MKYYISHQHITKLYWLVHHFRQLFYGQWVLQLDLLLSATPLAALMEESVQRSLLEPANLDGNMCHRVSAATPDGTFVLWVDQESSVLRRIEYPAATFAPEIAEDKLVDDLQLTVVEQSDNVTRYRQKHHVLTGSTGALPKDFARFDIET